MGDKYGFSGSDLYMSMPIDREKLGQKKVAKIQQEIERLEKDQAQKRELIERLSRMQDNQDRQQDVQNNVLNRHNKDQLLVAEMERLYGRDSAMSMKKGGNETVDNVIAHRTKEFSRQQQAKEIEARFLVQERERLQAAREKVREQRRTLQTMTPAGKAQKLPSQEKANKRTHPRAPKQPAWEYDALAFLKTLGLYHHVEKPIFLPTPPRRRRRRKFRYYPCPLNRRFAWTW